MKVIKNLTIIIAMIFSLSTPTISPALASQNSDVLLKAELQAAMQREIESRLVDGGYMHFDSRKNKIATYYPMKAHPMMLRMGDDYILCSDFQNKAGENVNVDFFLTRRGKSFIVFQTSIDARSSVIELVNSGVASVFN